MFRLSSANLAKQNKLVKIFLWTPQIRLQDAMILAKYSNEEIEDKAFHHFLRRTLPSGSLKRLKAHIAGVVLPPPDCTQQCHKRAIECTPPLFEGTSPDIDPVVDHVERAPATRIASLFPNKEMNQGAAALKLKRKEYNLAHYKKRKVRALATMSTTMTTMTTTTMTTTMMTVTITTMTTPAAATSSSVDPWSVTIHGTPRMPAAARKAKCKMVKPGQW
jgi:hypothetical protein